MTKLILCLSPLLLFACIAHATETESEITAYPQRTYPGWPVLISWESHGAQRCSGAGFETDNEIAGTAVVNPWVTQTFSVSCDGALAFTTVQVSE